MERKRKTRFLGAEKETGSLESINKNKLSEYKMCKIFRGPDQTKQAQSAKTTKMWNTFVLGQSAP